MRAIIKFGFLICCSLQFMQGPAQTTVREWFGVNSFLGGYKYGHSWPPENLLSESKIKRFYLANENTSRYENIFHLHRSTTGWGWEESLQDYKRQGQTTILALLGGFSYQTMDGKIGARMPINKGADPTNPTSYYTLARLCYNIAARWGANTKAQLNPNELANFSNQVYNFKTDKASVLPSAEWETLPVVGKNLVDYIEVLNEWDNFWSGSSVTFTAESYAVCLKTCYDAIKSADPSMKVLLGALYKPDIALINAVKYHWEKKYGKWPSDLYVNYHRYLHNGLAGGKRTGGVLPEAKPYGILNQVAEMDALGGPWFITEYGWDSDSTSQQRAPVLVEADGVTLMSREKSKGVLLVRSALLYATSKNCKGNIFYQIRNESNSHHGYLYASAGIYSKIYTPGTGVVYKPTEALAPIQEFLAQVGTFNLPARLVSDKSPYAVEFVNGAERIICTWTDTGAVLYKQEKTGSKR
jgi:hypothetical protein